MVVIVTGNNDFSIETDVENSYVSFIKNQGYIAIKVNKRGWPDRITILDYGYSFYIEFKRKVDKFGKRKGEKLQKHTHKKITDKGTHVYLADNLQHAKEIFYHELSIANALAEYHVLILPKRYEDEV